MQASEVTAVILAGGMGRRMHGLDKGLVELKDRAMISYVIDVLKPQVKEVLVNANRNTEQYRRLDVRVVADSIAGYQGPLAGFEAGMSIADTPWVYFCPCDSPLHSKHLLPHLWESVQGSDAQIAVASDADRTHPVFCLVQTGLLDSLRGYLGEGKRKIDHWFAEHRLLTVDCSDFAESFININTEEELAHTSAKLRLNTGA